MLCHKNIDCKSCPDFLECSTEAQDEYYVQEGNDVPFDDDDYPLYEDY